MRSSEVAGNQTLWELEIKSLSAATDSKMNPMAVFLDLLRYQAPKKKNSINQQQSSF
jgi:hypothetical protein